MRYILPRIQLQCGPKPLRKVHRYHLAAQSKRPMYPREPLSAITATKLIKSLSLQGSLVLARKVFDEMPDKDVVAWTAMISSYALSGRNVDAMETFKEMMVAGVKPNAYTLSSALTVRGCGTVTALHGLAVRLGVDRKTYVENALLDAYAGDGVGDARKVFDEMEERTAVSWTAMITAYTRCGEAHEGVRLFRRSIQEGVELTPFTCSIAVRACASISNRTTGSQVHAAVIRSGIDKDVPVGNSLVDMYSRCMRLSEAKQCFDEMPVKDLITWNAMIAGFERYGSCEALHLLLRMNSEGIQPNCFTFTSIVAACGNLAVLNVGQQVHGATIHRGFTENNQIANALVDMYAKCGDVADAQKSFTEMHDKDLVSWTSMMIGFGMHGYGKEALALFDEMIVAGVQPDSVVFMGVIGACSHAGLVDEGLKYFNLMTSVYSVLPDKEIYGCAIDLLGRAGRVLEAHDLIQKMQFEPDESIWGALLAACKMHKNVALGRLAAQRMLDLKPRGATTYVLLSNMYAGCEEWSEFRETRKMLKEMGSRKEVGRSWIEVRDEVCSFAAGDRSSPHTGMVYEVLDILVLQMNDSAFVSCLDEFQHDLGDLS